MGTRSLTYVYDEDARPLICMYRQMDGYPEGHGQELFDFLDGVPMVNGIGENTRVFNGAGCMAAQLVAHFKEGAGGFYMEPVSPRVIDAGQDYEYELHYGEHEITVRVIDTRNRRKKAGKDFGTIFSGTLAEYGLWLASLKE